MSESFQYPSDIASVTMGLKPDTTLPVWKGEACQCSHCSRSIEEGEHYERSKVGQFFSDTRSLVTSLGAAQPNKPRAICWRCSWLRKRPMLYGMAAAVVTPEHVYPIHKDVHKAWAFTTPPEGPFFVTHASATMQHLAWRTPITYDNRRIFVRFGNDLFVVRPEAMRKALRICDDMNKDQPRWRSPLILDRKANVSTNGHLTRYGKETLTADDASFLANDLTQGEYWALAYLMHSNRPVPENPEPITASILEKINK